MRVDMAGLYDRGFQEGRKHEAATNGRALDLAHLVLRYEDHIASGRSGVAHLRAMKELYRDMIRQATNIVEAR